jgi:hypothetical protein
MLLAVCMKQVWSYVTGSVYETSVVLCYWHCLCMKQVWPYVLALSVYETSVVLCYWHYLCMKQVWPYVTGTICV